MRTKSNYLNTLFWRKYIYEEMANQIERKLVVELCKNILYNNTDFI